MSTKNNTTPAPQEQPLTQAEAAFIKAFLAKHRATNKPHIEPMDISERITAFDDLFSAGDFSAAGLVIGDAIMSLEHKKRQAVLDLLIWAILRDEPDWGE